MSSLAEVRLWGTRIAAVKLDEDTRVAEFQYDPDFVKSSIQISPITMPLTNQIYTFPELPFNTFYGLPGLLSDSLPDKFGNILINEWLARQGRLPDSLNAIERLCYIGSRGMGALEFYPSTGPDSKTPAKIEIEPLVRLASEILSKRDNFRTYLAAKGEDAALKDILRVGTSAGGARAKAIIAWNENTQEIRSGQIHAGDGFQYWILKFDGVSGNKDRELEDPKGYGIIEYAYHRMAVASGIEMSECRLLEENGRHHFMTKRFDRKPDGQKLHMQSLGALAHFDYNTSGANSYEQAFSVMRKLELPASSIEEQFRRMAFNIVARNHDDHVKNIAFLMDRSGIWSLSPAFDITYSYNPGGIWTNRHQMSMNGKYDNFTLQDFHECGKKIHLKRGRAEAIVEQVTGIARNWPFYANIAGVPEKQILQIQSVLRINLFD